MKMNIYEENGFKDRNEYLEYLSEEYDLSIASIKMLARTLGEEEDFDALVSYLEDIQE
jgi:hypothetical protein